MVTIVDDIANDDVVTIVDDMLMMMMMQDTAREAGCLVTGGQTVINPWCTIGQ